MGAEYNEKYVQQVKQEILEVMSDGIRRTPKMLARETKRGEAYIKAATHRLVDEGLITRHVTVTGVVLTLNTLKGFATDEEVARVKTLIRVSLEQKKRRITASEVINKVAPDASPAAVRLALDELKREGEFTTLSVMYLTIFEPKGYVHAR